MGPSFQCVTMPPLHAQPINFAISRPLSLIKVIGECYHMTTMDESVSWIKLAHFLSFLPLCIRGPFVCLPLLQNS